MTPKLTPTDADRTTRERFELVLPRGSRTQRETTPDFGLVAGMSVNYEATKGLRIESEEPDPELLD